MLGDLFNFSKVSQLFICQIQEDGIKAVKCLLLKEGRVDFAAAEELNFASKPTDKEISDGIKGLLRKLQFQDGALIISLPRHLVTCRYLKVPSVSPEEIEKIVALQAPRYLPFPAEELVTAYELVSRDNEGFSHINLIICHKEAINRSLAAVRDLRVQKTDIFLSSYGICSLFNRSLPRQEGTVMLLDVSSGVAELAVIRDKKLLFSRIFKVSTAQLNWEGLLAEEIKKSQDAYARDVTGAAAEELFLTGVPSMCEEFSQALSTRLSIPVKILPLAQSLNTEKISRVISVSSRSYAGLLGLGLASLPDSLNIIPQKVKDKARQALKTGERVRLGLFIGVIIILWGLGIVKSLDNRSMRLERLKKEVAKISKEAEQLEELEGRLRLLEERSQSRYSCLEVLAELQRIIPDGLLLVNFIYDGGSAISLRGQANSLGLISTLVGKLKDSSVLGAFEPKVRYATQKKGARGEFIDFEVVCSKK